MFVISGSMPKSGSGWYFNMTNDLLVATGHFNAKLLPEHDEVGHLFINPNAGVRRLTSSVLQPLDKFCQRGQSFVISTHGLARRPARQLLKSGRAKGTYIYRDPRDVLVSAMEHGKRIRDSDELKRLFIIGPYQNFAKLHTIRGTILYLKFKVFPIWRSWHRAENVHFTRYEDCLSDTAGELKRLCDYLGLVVPATTIDQIVERYQPANLDAIKANRLHMHKGGSGRFREVLSTAEQQLCNRKLGKMLRAMNYEI